MHAAVDVRQHGPGEGVQEQRGKTEEGGDDEDPAHDQRVDAQPDRDAGGDTAEPPVGADDAEPGDPQEEAIGATGCARGVRRRHIVVGGRRRGGRNRHMSILAVAGAAVPWGEPLSTP
ncbi:hypothetical protein [Microbacterium sp. 1S1]|uniref:hypothetical protein n=1 Tax=Microbacterium sp. 1S1 TaxID=2606451 RepID=UPI0021CCCD16|nr:hypothetical protein [Microbacterium sp. 1S1]